MPHLTIQYSANMESKLKIDELCSEMHEVMLATGVFPLAGIRVRAFRADAVAIADRLPDNVFIDMVLRMGEGRTMEVKQQAGDQIFKRAEEFCSDLLATPHFALSMEIVEIKKAYSWKTNTMHPRLETS